ncbi:unnamed protein product, partial [Didymodactylos carnosus]
MYLSIILPINSKNVIVEKDFSRDEDVHDSQLEELYRAVTALDTVNTSTAKSNCFHPLQHTSNTYPSTVSATTADIQLTCSPCKPENYEADSTDSEILSGRRAITGRFLHFTSTPKICSSVKRNTHFRSNRTKTTPRQQTEDILLPVDDGRISRLYKNSFDELCGWLIGVLES